MNPVWTVETQISKVWLDNDGIIYYTYVPQSGETIEEAKKVFGEVKLKTQGKRHPVLVDLSSLHSVTSEARAFHAGKESAQVYTAVGLVVNNPVSKIIGNFFLNLNKPVFPVKLFSSKDEALIWLKPYVSTQ